MQKWWKARIDFYFFVLLDYINDAADIQPNTEQQDHEKNKTRKKEVWNERKKIRI